MMSPVLLLLLALQISSDPTAGAADTWQELPLKKLSEIELPPEVLPGDWTTSDGISVDDLSQTETLSPALREIVDPIAANFLPLGGRSVADYSLAKTKLPLNMVTVRVFVFDTPQQCKAWWSKKYEIDGWEQYYEKFECSGAAAVRSLQMNKVAMAFGNVWLTTHQLQEGDEHIVAANFVLKSLTDGKRQIPLREDTKGNGDEPAPAPIDAQ